MSECDVLTAGRRRELKINSCILCSQHTQTRMFQFHKMRVKFGKYVNSISITNEVETTKKFLFKQVTDSDVSSTDCRW